MGWWDDERPKPRRPANGIKAQNQRGAFGKSWWATRWIAALERLLDNGRLQRGRTYARQGQVLNIDITPGHVAARVQGSSARPYKVSIDIKALDDAAWARVINELASQAIFAAKLLAGEMPQDVEQAFEAARTNLFPTKRGDLRTDCTCPDDSNPCKHIAAVYYLLGEQFDTDPFLIFQLRGRTREQIIDALRARRAGDPIVSAAPVVPAEHAPPLAELTAHFWAISDPAAFDALQPQIIAPTVEAAPLKVLGPPPFWPDRAAFLAAFQPTYTAATTRALAIVQSEDGEG